MKKKGFTLIELLAVIVILAVIALIAVPIILNIIESTKISGAEKSALGYVRAVNYSLANLILNDKDIDYINGDFDISELEFDVKYDNQGPSSGMLRIRNSTVTYGELCISNYSIKVENGLASYQKDEDYCEIDYDPQIPFKEPEGIYVGDLCEEETYDNTVLYKIKTPNDLKCLATVVNKGNSFADSEKGISLVSDIDMSGASMKPIGTSTSPFAGVFEGNAFKISNLSISSGDNTGLFGYVKGENAVVQGFYIKNARISGGTGVGIIAGTIEKGIIKDIIINGTVTGSGRFIGGAVGKISTSGNLIKGVISNTNVTMNYYGDYGYAGGLVGYQVEGNEITGIVLGGTIKGNYAWRAQLGAAFGTNNSYTGAVFTSKSVVVNDDSYSNGADGKVLSSEHINGKHSLGTYDGFFDTYIGGDNDNNNYYYDYDENFNLIIKNKLINPLKVVLKGKGTKEKPYIIRNAKDWKNASLVSSSNKYFEIRGDIDFTDSAFYPLGTSSNRFNSTLNGNYKNISGLTIRGSSNVGLIGYVENGYIKGLKINNTSISGYGNAGLVGYFDGGEISDINFAGTVYGNGSNVGGIVGLLKKGTINEVIMKGSVTGTGINIGGVIGQISTSGNSIKGIVSNTNVTMTYSGEKGTAGGLVGYQVAGNEISGVVLGGTIQGNNSWRAQLGAAFGTNNSYSGTIFTSKSVVVKDDSYSNGADGNILSAYYNNRHALGAYDSAIDTYIGGDNDESGYYFDYDDDGSIDLYYVKDNPLEFTLEGEGTASKPYIINNADDLKQISLKLNENKTFEIKKSIDFTNKNFYMIGTKTNPFKGNIKGNMNSLSNIAIKGSNYAGFIGYLTDGKIEGITFNNVSVSGYSYVGLIGYMENGEIIGINSLKSSTYGKGQSVGGIVGYSKKVVGKELYYNGKVTSGGSYCGGIIGKNDDSSSSLMGVIVNSDIIANGNEDYGGNAGGIVGLTPAGITMYGIVEGGNIKSTYAWRGQYGSVTGKYISSYTGKVYASSSIEIDSSYNSGINGISFSPNNVNDLLYYSNLGVKIETSTTGDTNGTGYYFGYDKTGEDVIVVKANSGTSQGSLTPENIITGTVSGNDSSDTVAPVCTLNLFQTRSEKDGFNAQVTCTDNVGVTEMRTQFNSNKINSINNFSDIGTVKTGVAITNGKRVTTVWTAETDPAHKPSPGLCTYFRYGAMDAAGNYSYYITNYCLSY